MTSTQWFIFSNAGKKDFAYNVLVQSSEEDMQNLKEAILAYNESIENSKKFDKNHVMRLSQNPGPGNEFDVDKFVADVEELVRDVDMQHDQKLFNEVLNALEEALDENFQEESADDDEDNGSIGAASESNEEEAQSQQSVDVDTESESNEQPEQSDDDSSDEEDEESQDSETKEIWYLTYKNLNSKLVAAAQFDDDWDDQGFDELFDELLDDTLPRDSATEPLPNKFNKKNLKAGGLLPLDPKMLSIKMSKTLPPNAKKRSEIFDDLYEVRDRSILQQSYDRVLEAFEILQSQSPRKGKVHHYICVDFIQKYYLVQEEREDQREQVCLPIHSENIDLTKEFVDKFLQPFFKHPAHKYKKTATVQTKPASKDSVATADYFLRNLQYNLENTTYFTEFNGLIDYIDDTMPVEADSDNSQSTNSMETSAAGASGSTDADSTETGSTFSQVSTATASVSHDAEKMRSAQTTDAAHALLALDSPVQIAMPKAKINCRNYTAADIRTIAAMKGFDIMQAPPNEKKFVTKVELCKMINATFGKSKAKKTTNKKAPKKASASNSRTTSRSSSRRSSTATATSKNDSVEKPSTKINCGKKTPGEVTQIADAMDIDLKRDPATLRPRQSKNKSKRELCKEINSQLPKKSRKKSQPKSDAASTSATSNQSEATDANDAGSNSSTLRSSRSTGSRSTGSRSSGSTGSRSTGSRSTSSKSTGSRSSTTTQSADDSNSMTASADVEPVATSDDKDALANLLGGAPISCRKTKKDVLLQVAEQIGVQVEKSQRLPGQEMLKNKPALCKDIKQVRPDLFTKKGIQNLQTASVEPKSNKPAQSKPKQQQKMTKKKAAPKSKNDLQSLLGHVFLVSGRFKNNTKEQLCIEIERRAGQCRKNPTLDVTHVLAAPGQPLSKKAQKAMARNAQVTLVSPEYIENPVPENVVVLEDDLAQSVQVEAQSVQDKAQSVQNESVTIVQIGESSADELSASTVIADTELSVDESEASSESAPIVNARRKRGAAARQIQDGTESEDDDDDDDPNNIGSANFEETEETLVGSETFEDEFAGMTAAERRLAIATNSELASRSTDSQEELSGDFVAPDETEAASATSSVDWDAVKKIVKRDMPKYKKLKAANKDEFFSNKSVQELFEKMLEALVLSGDVVLADNLHELDAPLRKFLLKLIGDDELDDIYMQHHGANFAEIVAHKRQTLL